MAKATYQDIEALRYDPRQVYETLDFSDKDSHPLSRYFIEAKKQIELTPPCEAKTQALWTFAILQNEVERWLNGDATPSASTSPEA